MRDEYLDPEYLPEVLPHREGETAEIFELLKPVASGKKPVNVFIYGPAGIGKTAVSKFVSKTFSEERVRGVYINCWYHRTEVAVLAEALRQLSYPVPRKGRSVDELVEDFVRNSEGERLVFVMDEIDALTDDGALYILSRAPTPIGIVMISNDPFAMRNLDQRARSSLAPSEIEFKKYSVEELDSILQERARLAFREFDPVAIKVAARFAFRNGSDVRYGLSLLQRAGRLADKTGLPLGIEHIKAVEVNKNPKKEERQEELKGEHRLVVEAMKSLGGSAPSLEVFAKYLKEGGKGAERTFRKYVRELIELKVLTEEDIPGRGKRRMLKLSN